MAVATSRSHVQAEVSGNGHRENRTLRVMGFCAGTNIFNGGSKVCYSLLLRRKKTEDPFTRLLGHSLFLSLQVDQLVVSCSVSEAIA